ncbi:phosphatidylethanolamine N-methyltransferase /phosphatidyl-N-methylethanolamine N-methyltransferase [Hoeflea marina]|uniref:Phosphatidylethanolamine N-methyltransferase /phosphatidyl-N-methylethanolamine N-methyltransferase n=1 Tax=Hoeflea marina TaxID=274592 RepID=A0A317PKV2_9HYPH|nr:methyltransferase domain-containing protein [Hoeflea marina]PWW00476.1 phosphatidylethanolamine N-methyltransferase /phosphatidyl-N-methylethanolamine N-methyltransferase [Hoeflea marina]
MSFGFQARIARRFDEEIRFFKGWIHGPKTVGSIMPTSLTAARSMASLIDPASGLPVLELGPGTGVITRAILARGLAPEKLVSIEYSAEFHARLTADMPAVNFIRGDAFNLALTLGPWREQTFDSVVSGIPLLNFPMEQRVALLEDLLDRVPPGRPVVQFSYGPSSPIAPRRGSYTVAHHDFVMRNVPPARLWVYRRGI